MSAHARLLVLVAGVSLPLVALLLTIRVTGLVLALAITTLIVVWIGGIVLLVRPFEQTMDVMEETVTRGARQTELAEQRYRGLFERNIAGIFRTRDGRFVDCNPAFARIFGYASPEELMDRPVAELYASSEDRERLIEDLAAGDPVTRELRGRRKDGSEVWVLLHIVEVKGETATFREGMLIDITDRRPL